ncbi:hypothetical protein [Myceligenerans crystallogenes]|uniref:Uncharacterized protein n=1 Tax=Myceligenerans crystallogenes TaxID=316335 RepID=A0ABP4ZTR0_9MICO
MEYYPRNGRLDRSHRARLVGLVLAAAAAFTLSACEDVSDPGAGPSPEQTASGNAATSSDTEPTTSAAADSPEAGLDPAAAGTFEADETTGHIRFPIDAYQDSYRELVTLDYARAIGVAACARLDGLDVRVVQQDLAVYDTPFMPFGAWARPVAEQWAFSSGPDLQPALEWYVGGSVSAAGVAKKEADQAVLDECWESAEVARFDPMLVTSMGEPAQDWRGEIEQIWLGLEQGKDFRAVEKEYEACLETVGVEPSADVRGGATGMEVSDRSQPQIDLALHVVGCKERTGYVDRLAGLVATRQEAVIARHQEELTAFRAELDGVLAAAEEFIALNEADLVVAG